MCSLATGCATATREVLKVPSLKEGDPYAEIDIQKPSFLAEYAVLKVARRFENGELRDEPLLDKDTVGKNAAKIAFMLTPLGMVNRAMTGGLSASPLIYLPPGEAEFLVGLTARKVVPGETGLKDSPRKYLESTWCYRLPATLEAGGKYVIAYRERPIVLDGDGKVISTADSAQILAHKEVNTNAFILEMASEDLIAAGVENARRRGMRPIPIYADGNGNLQIVSGTADLIQLAVGDGLWAVKDEMFINVGKGPFTLNGHTLERGEFMYFLDGKIQKASFF